MMDSIDHHSSDTVVVILHGGLNNLRNRPKATEAILRAFRETPGYYPIVVNWNSGAGSTYIDQSVRVRSGQYVQSESWQKPLFITMNSASDLLVGIVDAPRAATNRAFELLHDRRMPSPPADDVFVADHLLIEIGKSRRYGWRSFGADAIAAVELPAKLLTGIVVEGFGGRMWQNMSRRTRLAVRTKDDYCSTFRREPVAHQNPCVRYMEESGAVATLFDSLQARAGKRKKGNEMHVVLIAHSMGTMIANNVLRMSLTAREDGSRSLFREIVYMAAASSVRDIESTIVPYMQRHDSTTFSMLTLHPGNESREVNYLGLIPRGSLLTWIDAGFERTRSFDDRTAGRFANMTSALTIFPTELRSRVSLKMFSERGSKIPQKHGQFMDPTLRFWLPAFRMVQKSKGKEPPKNLR
ncbi:MAG: hypothetical protein IBJ03_08535 [Gemmatimonadaceae bacterium]|nr:hypothetical protein [Gemmatimonadaceae bacterium]